MTNSAPHSFHIPVMGLAYTLTTPLKVARFGISSVVSIIDDQLVERMRKHLCEQHGEPYEAITKEEDDCRALRVTAFLNLMHKLLTRQIEEFLKLPFTEGSDMSKFFELLPDGDLKSEYLDMLSLPEGDTRRARQDELRKKTVVGAIDVNIMCKIDSMRYTHTGQPLPPEYSDALSALRGFALSTLSSSVVLSAGYNPRLYAYLENFKDFYPDSNQNLKKKVTLKVSDYRSALIQGKLLAKRGIWISEYRIESGLNCGGHAFATEGYLLGPILEEFRTMREKLKAELFEICQQALETKGIEKFDKMPELKISVQGGLGTNTEREFMMDHYHADSTGWGSPFLLVPEATSVDDETLAKLATAEKDDYFLSEASPLGIPFNNFRKSSAEAQRKMRIDKNRPGSPCYKKYLSSDTEFTEFPICTASREYQHAKLKQLDEMALPPDEYEARFNSITAKDCLCEGLGASALLKEQIVPEHKMTAVSICPGPNLAYFSGVFSLKQMVDHIYGRTNLLNSTPRPHMFINELEMYVDYLRKQILKSAQAMNVKQERYLNSFRNNLLQGISYYEDLCRILNEPLHLRERFVHALNKLKQDIEYLAIDNALEV